MIPRSIVPPVREITRISKDSGARGASLRCVYRLADGDGSPYDFSNRDGTDRALRDAGRACAWDRAAAVPKEAELQDAASNTLTRFF
jgi:hypothetical protein